MVNRRRQLVRSAGALLIIGAGVGWWAAVRLHDARQFARSHRVQTYAGTNYVVRLVETTVGKVASGYVVIVYARFENPNPSEIVLRRDWFVLMDHDKDYYQPTTGGTQAPLIRLPPHGVSERETLSYVVGNDAFAGSLALEIGHHYFVLLKSDKPWSGPLSEGQFVTFHGRAW